MYAPVSRNLTRPPQVAPPSRSKMALNRRSLSFQRYTEFLHGLGGELVELFRITLGEIDRMLRWVGGDMDAGRKADGLAAEEAERVAYARTISRFRVNGNPLRVRG